MFIPPFIVVEHTKDHARYEFITINDTLHHIKIFRYKNRITVPFSDQQLDKIRKYIINETDLKIKEYTSKYSHELRCLKDKNQSLIPTKDTLVCKICGYEKYYVSAWIIENNK